MTNYDKESQLKSAVEAQQMAGQTIGKNTQIANMKSGNYEARRPSPLESMEAQQARESEAAQLRSEGIEFLRANPAFDQFIVLIRKGAIGI